MKISVSPTECGGWELVEAEVTITGRGALTEHGSAWRTLLFRWQCQQ